MTLPGAATFCATWTNVERTGSPSHDGGGAGFPSSTVAKASRSRCVTAHTR